MTLSGSQAEKLQNALLDAFPGKSSLEQMLFYKLDKKLNEIAGEGSLKDIVSKLIKTAEAEGWTEDLVKRAHLHNPGNLNLKAVAEELFPSNPTKPQTTSVDEPQSEVQTGVQTQPITQQQKILILTAIPHGLRLDKEIREIQAAIERAARRDLFAILIRTAVRPQDIRRAIAEEEPQIVHFCGHGLEDGSLVLEDDGGNNKPVTSEALASLFRLNADYVKCVLLNACHSQKPAKAISQYIDYVIGMNQPIQDKAAIEFAKGFYDGLGYKKSSNQDVFKRAFDEGMVAIEMENLAQGLIPVLEQRKPH
ncbi:MAG: CHAT domain-containing protein [Scytonematopsis contorta HA4267-MV1]|jgi:hypothetical protein|nr:CHAT domain-containing protein [Scytonematopsis contorta HA4267-MV1]